MSDWHFIELETDNGAPNEIINFSILFRDKDGDDLIFVISDSWGNVSEATKIERDAEYYHADFIWPIPSESGPGVLIVELSDSKSEGVFHIINVNIIAENNSLPVINSVKLVELAIGRVIEVDESAHVIKGGYEYRIEIDVNDPDGDDMGNTIEFSGGTLRIDTDYDIWSNHIWTPPVPDDEIILKYTITVRVAELGGSQEVKKSIEVFITN